MGQIKSNHPAIAFVALFWQGSDFYAVLRNLCSTGAVASRRSFTPVHFQIPSWMMTHITTTLANFSRRAVTNSKNALSLKGTRGSLFRLKPARSTLQARHSCSHHDSPGSKSGSLHNHATCVHVLGDPLDSISLRMYVHHPHFATIGPPWLVPVQDGVDGAFVQWIRMTSAPDLRCLSATHVYLSTGHAMWGATPTFRR